jgi:hypothetical protein
LTKEIADSYQLSSRSFAPSSTTLSEGGDQP